MKVELIRKDGKTEAFFNGLEEEEEGHMTWIPDIFSCIVKRLAVALNTKFGLLDIGSPISCKIEKWAHQSKGPGSDSFEVVVSLHSKKVLNAFLKKTSDRLGQEKYYDLNSMGYESAKDVLGILMGELQNILDTYEYVPVADERDSWSFDISKKEM